MDIFSDLGPAAPAVRALFLTSTAVIWTLVLARLIGLRAFSKATAFDFAATIATGSLIAQAGTRSEWSDYVQAMAAIGAIFLVQYFLAKGRQLSKGFKQAIDNEPLLLLKNGEFRDEAMRSARISRATLLEKIRSSGAGSVADVHAIVLETTGDLSIMMSREIGPELLDDVRGA